MIALARGHGLKFIFSLVWMLNMYYNRDEISCRKSNDYLVSLFFRIEYLYQAMICLDKNLFFQHEIRYLFKMKCMYQCKSQFFSFMNFGDMLCQITVFRKGSITNITFEWPIFFMNWCYMMFQFIFYRQAVATNVTSEWILFFHELMLYVHSSHLNGLYPSWTDKTCSFMLPFREKL